MLIEIENVTENFQLPTKDEISPFWRWSALRAGYPYNLIEMTICFSGIADNEKDVIEKAIETFGKETPCWSLDVNGKYRLRTGDKQLTAISHFWLCKKQSEDLQKLCKDLIKVIRVTEPELAYQMVPKCVSCGFCPEQSGCGYSYTADYGMRRIVYEQGLMINFD